MPIKLKKVEKKAVQAVGMKLAAFLETELYAIAQREMLGIDSKLVLEKAAKGLVSGHRSVLNQVAEEEIRTMITAPEARKQIAAAVREELRRIGFTELAKAMVAQSFEKLRFDDRRGVCCCDDSDY